MSKLRNLRRKGEIEAKVGITPFRRKQETPQGGVARIFRGPHGFVFVNEHFIPPNDRPALAYPVKKKGNTEEVRKARNLRKKHNRSAPARTFLLPKIPTDQAVFPSLEAAHQAAAKARFKWTRWNGKLRKCKYQADSKATPKPNKEDS